MSFSTPPWVRLILIHDIDAGKTLGIVTGSSGMGPGSRPWVLDTGHSGTLAHDGHTTTWSYSILPQPVVGHPQHTPVTAFLLLLKPPLFLWQLSLILDYWELAIFVFGKLGKRQKLSWHGEASGSKACSSVR